MKLTDLFTPEQIFLDLPARTREEVLVLVAEQLERLGAVKRAQDLVDLLLERERLGATVVGDETAIPHCKVPGLKGIIGAFARVPETIQFGSGDSEQARLFFFVLSPREQPAAHLQVLANIARLLRNPQARRLFIEAGSGEELLDGLRDIEAGQ